MANKQKVGSGNRDQAPKLAFNGDKYNNIDKSAAGYYEIPQKLADLIFNTFPRQPAPIRLMILLIGTKPGFGLSEKWVIERTGLTHKAYDDSRKLLGKMGWITHADGFITVNFDKMYSSIESIPQSFDVSSEYGKMDSSIESIRQNNDRGIESIPQNSSIQSIPQNELEYLLNTSKSDSVNTSKQVLEYSEDKLCGIESIPIIYNITDNNTINNKEYISEQPPLVEVDYPVCTDYPLSCVLSDMGGIVEREDEEWVYVGNIGSKKARAKFIKPKRTAAEWASQF